MYPPFNEEHQLDDMHPTDPRYDDRLPSQPLISIASDPGRLFDFLDKDLLTTDLDRMAPNLWLMATQSGLNISPLHHQKIKGRRIVITEDPRLHLVWIDNRIFIKPFPLYLQSFAFWAKYLNESMSTDANLKSPNNMFPDWSMRKEPISRAALGLLRSYALLIRHSSDLELAINHRLLPPETTFLSFCQFASRFPSIPDSDVSPRYGYGELRLARLNFWSKIFLGRWNYETVHRQYSEYFQRFYGPLLFTFGFFSVVLSALQVEMAVESVWMSNQWPGFWGVSRAFSIISLCFVGLPALALVLLFVGKVMMELLYALTHRRTPD
ncbi:MAG: hypothetical protein Q9175_000131 [Cornicularia normoerica]